MDFLYGLSKELEFMSGGEVQNPSADAWSSKLFLAWVLKDWLLKCLPKGESCMASMG